ncbi:MAG: glycosyltransferase family 4 protein [Planctomycetes bacterium]|nr:glycosyltransferase family 4 protein [Planctomycetota bacterium]
MKKLKIAIIAHCCRTGGGLSMTLNLLRAMNDIAQDEQFLLIYSSGYGYENIKLSPGSESFFYKGSHSPPARYLFEKFKLPRLIKNYNPDAIFSASNVGLPSISVPQAVLIGQPHLLYDKKHYPQIHLRLQLRIEALKIQTRKFLPSTDIIYAQIPVVKRRFAERYNYPENQIKVLPLPTPAEIKPVEGIEAPALFDKSADNFYILMMTRYMAHRNPGILIPLCKRYADQLRDKKIKFITTVEREDDILVDKFLKNISRYHLEDIITNVGSLSRQEVVQYFSHSQAFWMPTTMETLGLPFLESMTMGVPILAPDLDFARYVCGEAALFYDPWDIDSMFNSVISIRTEESLRQKLIAKGKEEIANSERFASNWEEPAAQIIQDLRFLVTGDKI